MKNKIIFKINYFFLFFLYLLVMFFMPVYLNYLKFSEKDISLLVLFFSFGLILGEITIPYFVDKNNIGKKAIMINYILLVLIFICLKLVNNQYIFIIFYFLLGFFFTIISLNDSYITKFNFKNLTNIRMFGSFGASFCALSIGYLISLNSPVIIINIALFISFLLFINAFFLPIIQNKENKEVKYILKNIHKSIDKKTVNFLIITFLFYSPLISNSNFFANFAKNNLNFSSNEISNLVFTMIFLESIFIYLYNIYKYKKQKIQKETILKVIIFITLIRFLSYIFINNQTFIFIISTTQALSLGFFIPYALDFIGLNDNLKKIRTQVFALYQIIILLGNLLLNFIIFLFISNFNFFKIEYIYFIYSLFLLLAFLKSFQKR